VLSEDKYKIRILPCINIKPVWGVEDGEKNWDKQRSDSIKSLMRALVPKLFTAYSMCSSVLELLTVNVFCYLQVFFSLFLLDFAV